MSDRRDRALRLLLADRLLDVLDGDPLGEALLGAMREQPVVLRELLDVDDVREMRGLVGRTPARLRVQLVEALVSLWEAAADDETAAACAIDQTLVEDYVSALAEAGSTPRSTTLADLASVVSWDVVIASLSRHLSPSLVVDVLLDSWPLESSGGHAALLAEVARRARWRERMNVIERLAEAIGPAPDPALTALHSDLFGSEWMVRDGVVSPDEHVALHALRDAIANGAPDDDVQTLARRALVLLAGA